MSPRPHSYTPFGDDMFTTENGAGIPGPIGANLSIEEPQHQVATGSSSSGQIGFSVAALVAATGGAVSTTNTTTTTAPKPRAGWGWQRGDRELAKLTTQEFMNKFLQTHHYRRWHGMDAFGDRLQNAFLGQYQWHGKNVVGLKDWGYGPDKLEWIQANDAGAGQMYRMSEHLKKYGQRADFTPFLQKMRLGSGGRGRLHLSGGKRGTSTPGAWATDRMRSAIMDAMDAKMLAALKADFGIN